jgi:hypothetical protein
LSERGKDWNTCRCPYFPNNFAQNPLEPEIPPEIANEGIGPLLRPLPNPEQQRVERLMQVPEDTRRREQTEIENTEHVRNRDSYENVKRPGEIAMLGESRTVVAKDEDKNEEG